MPNLDVSDLLLDPDFCDTTLLCSRNTQTVGANGLASISTTTFNFVGVVTQIRTQELDRTAAGEVIHGQILIITRCRLRAGDPSHTADIVTWLSNTYTVTDVQNYSTYGRGFVEATCDLLPMTG